MVNPSTKEKANCVYKKKCLNQVLEKYFTMETPKQCKTDWQFDPVKGWKLKLSGDCGETLEEIEALPPRKRDYLKRRIEVEDYEPSSVSSTAS